MTTMKFSAHREPYNPQQLTSYGNGAVSAPIPPHEFPSGPLGWRGIFVLSAPCLLQLHLT